MYLLQQLLEQSSERAPEKSALVSQSRRLTYREIDDEANRIASSLRHAGAGHLQLRNERLERRRRQYGGLRQCLPGGWL